MEGLQMMDVTQLAKGSILLAPNHLHAQLREEFLKQKTGVLGIQIFSIQGFLTTFYEAPIADIIAVLFSLKEQINSLLPQLTIYQEIASTPLFLEECYRFIDHTRFWNVTYDDLPQDSLAQQELALILRQFYPIKTASSNMRQALQKIEHQTLDNLYILDSYHTLEEQEIIQILMKQGAHYLDVPIYQPAKHFFHAVNKRQEIEACAQYIIHQNLVAEDIHITLADTTYKPLLQQIFDRYQIPYTLLHTQQTSIITKRFLALFHYHLQPTTEHVLACMDCGLFQVKGYLRLREYIEIFNCDIIRPFIHLQNIQDTGHVLDEKEFEMLKQVEEKARVVQESLLPMLQSLKEPSSYDELLITMVNIVQTSASSQKDKQTLKEIRTLLQTIHSYLHTKEDIEFFLPFLEQITSSNKVSELTGAIVADLRQDVYGRSHHFLLGCTQKMYPSFPTKKGIFNESYYALLTRYPSMDQRYQFDLSQLDKMLHKAPNIYASFPMGTYEGKGNEAALEIEQFMENPSSHYPLHVNYQEVPSSFTITKELAQQLFLHDGKIPGSISSVERYVKCPFSYFLRYGLSLREPMKHGFPNSYAGTLFHFMLESLTTAFGKEYANTTIDKIEEILHQEIKVMEQVFPQMLDKLANVEERMLSAILQNLEILTEFEQHSSLHPEKSEYAFTYEIPVQEDITFAMRGYIDRIDASHAFTCILDYKSSPKMLSEANVFAALQLQLLTYSMVVKQDFQQEVLGAYYVSFKSENITHSAGHMSRRKPVMHNPTGKEELEELRKRAHRFNGWSFHKEIDQLDDNGAHLVGVSANKDGEVKARKLYDLDSISEYLTEMYQIIGTRILDGDIRCTPMEDACTYCSYHDICRFKGLYAEKKLLVEVEDFIYQKGGEDDA